MPIVPLVSERADLFKQAFSHATVSIAQFLFHTFAYCSTSLLRSICFNRSIAQILFPTFVQLIAGELRAMFQSLNRVNPLSHWPDGEEVDIII